MEVQNPDYKYYKMLGGTWKSADGACEIVLGNGTSLIDITYGGGTLHTGYGIWKTDALSMMPSNSLLGLAALTYQRHDGEELKLNFEGVISNGDTGLYKVDVLWYGEDKLNLELTDTRDGHKEKIVLFREGKASGTTVAGTFQCECGNNYKSRFCPECGRARTEETPYSCSCGYHGQVGKFCPNCGKAVEA